MSPEAILNSYDLAGIRLKLARDQLFTYNNESELENAKNSEKTKSFMDFDEAKARLDRAKKQIKTQSEYAKAIRDEFELYLAKAKEEGKIYQSPNNNTNTPSENNSPAN